MNRERLKKTLRQAEGFSATPYFDCGFYTAGWGHQLPESWPVKERGAAESALVSKEQAEIWLDEDISVAYNGCIRVFGEEFEEFGSARVEALTEMFYMLGDSRFRGFKRMIAAIKERLWSIAAYEAKDSRWHSQIGKRAFRIERMLEFDVFDNPTT